MDLLTRIVRATWNEIIKPESYTKGEEFEQFVRSHLFCRDNYELLHRTHDYTSNKGDYIETSKEPDFKFKSKKRGTEFFVEAKYRSEFNKGAVEWCKPYQYRRYKDIDKKTPICVAIGVGKYPSSPVHVFAIPLKHIKYTQLFHSFLKEYEITPDQGMNDSKILPLLGH